MEGTTSRAVATRSWIVIWSACNPPLEVLLPTPIAAAPSVSHKRLTRTIHSCLDFSSDLANSEHDPHELSFGPDLLEDVSTCVS